ncbi:MAG: CHAP domain-containing protein [Pseudomonadota bacterium]
MRLRQLFLVSLVVRLAVLASGCTASHAPSRLHHPMLGNGDGEGGPHLVPFLGVHKPDFDGDPDQRAHDPASQAQRLRVAQAARRYVGQHQILVDGKALPYDCSGLARAAYLAQGIDVMNVDNREGENGVSAIYRYARQHGVVYKLARPEVGDLVFFHDTYDRNHNGRRDDMLTHVAVVERVEDDGTVTIVHTVARGVLRYRMNLRYPERVRDPDSGRRVNHYLRRGEGDQPSQTTAALFAGYATIIVDGAALAPDQHLAAR